MWRSPRRLKKFRWLNRLEKQDFSLRLKKSSKPQRM
jgi:hypothetical protein